MIRALAKSTARKLMQLAVGESGWLTLSGGNTPFLGGGAVSAAGPRVSGEAALKLSAAWGCVTRNAQVIGSLPVGLYEKQTDGSRVRLDNELSRILTAAPNPGQTALEFWEGMAAQVQMQGNAYAERLTIGRRLVGLRPLFGVVPEPRSDGRFNYSVLNADGRRRRLRPDEVFHLRGFGAGDGLGLSAIKYGVNSFGAALAADEAAGSVFGGGLMASGILKSEQTLTPDQRKALGGILDQYTGSRRAGKIMTLEAGLEFQPLQINAEDAQLLETRRFQVEDVCRWFGVPPIIIGHAGQGQTMWGTGVEAIMLAWLTTGINPQLRRIEARVLRDLIPAEKRGRWYLEFNREAMLQMDSKAKADFLSKMVSGGIMSSDEAREKLNLERRGGAADDLRAQVATAPIETLGKEI
ncbi:MAG: phage portal protein [Oceanibulbus sp.]|uniref:phage portal protein n=1 Tax=Sulfitobacter dubius TaxID=218673 RepID=UPI000C531E6E|nr:phage portal protein [Sulfitobacter sp.]